MIIFFAYLKELSYINFADTKLKEKDKPLIDNGDSKFRSCMKKV